MKRRAIVGSIRIFLVVSASYAASVARKTSAWEPYLAQLNQAPDLGATLNSPASHSVETDLMKLHEGESKELTHLIVGLKGVAANERYFQEISKLNQRTFDGIERAAQSHRDQKIDHRKVAAEVLQLVHQNPVANLTSTENYDLNGQIGYCFGRALLVHYLLLKSGVRQADIAKMFVLGDLKVQGQMWTFHVTVLVRDAKDGFIAVDPLMAGPIPYKDWIADTQKYEIKGKYSRARYYVTDPRKFLPSFGLYDRQQLDEPLLKKYFDGLAASLGKAPAKAK